MWQLLYCAKIARPDDSKKELTLNSSSGAWTFGREIKAIFVRENHSWYSNWYQILGDWIPCFELWIAFGDVKCFWVKWSACHPDAIWGIPRSRGCKGDSWAKSCAGRDVLNCELWMKCFWGMQRRNLKHPAGAKETVEVLSGGRARIVGWDRSNDTEGGPLLLLLFLDSIRWQIQSLFVHLLVPCARSK